MPSSPHSNVQRFLAKIRHVWRPHPGQREFLLHPAKFKVLACGRRWGKTDACAVQVVQALHRPYPTKHLVLAPTADQAALLFERAIELLSKIQGQEGRSSSESPSRTDLKVKRSPYPHLRYGAHTVMARSGHLPRALRGHEATHIIVDEAAYLPETLITEVAMPMLATSDGYLTLVSTPHGKNHFWRFYDMGLRGEHGIWSRSAPSVESPYVSDSFLQIQRELISQRAFAIEYEALFMDTAGQVFKTESVQACLVPKVTDRGGPYAIGVDWARYGDYTAVAVLAGNRDEASLLRLERFHGTTWTEAVRRVGEVLEAFRPARVLCDASGAGDPVIEQLRHSVPNLAISGLTFTSPAKAQLIDGLAWLIERGCLRMAPDPQLLRELEHFEARSTAHGNTKLEARSGYHDDLVVALALAATQLDKVYQASIGVGKPRSFTEG